MHRMTVLLLLVVAAVASGCRKQEPATEGGPPGGAAVATMDGGSAGPGTAGTGAAEPGEEATTTTTTTTTTLGDGGEGEAEEILPAVFISAQRAESFVGSFLLPDSRPVDGVWQPSRDDLDRLLAGLPARLESDRDTRGKVVAERLRRFLAGERPDASWDRYGVQVVGVAAGDRRLVYANFYCNPRNALRAGPQELVMVLDGGTCYFQVWFDPASGEYPRVVINGEA
ncbi:MAG: hypothetical protein JXB32_11780 [Deltaproteobacteria bacterium]|nr:hypothetical protein [Deltaproteobacteria bacterium]